MVAIVTISGVQLSMSSCGHRLFQNATALYSQFATAADPSNERPPVRVFVPMLVERRVDDLDCVQRAESSHLERRGAIRSRKSISVE